uniref:Uncharacterized protein n=1 Tax=Ciona savignyi TaxID=51511 RepID=H2Z9R7_CIOSA
TGESPCYYRPLLSPLITYITGSLDNSLQCATTCEDPLNFAYSVGYTYQYTYNAVVTSSFYEESTEGQRSTVQIQASLLVDVL